MLNITPEKIELIKTIKSKHGWAMKDEEYDALKEVIALLEELGTTSEPATDLVEKDGEVKLVGSNLYNKRKMYYNTTVEVWENTVTGDCSWGWMRTPDTYEEEDPDFGIGVDMGYLN